MREFCQAFTSAQNWPVSLWLVVMGLAGIATGAALGRPFAQAVFSEHMPALPGHVMLTLLLWAVTLGPLYWFDLPMQNRWRRAGVAGVLGVALFTAWQNGGSAAAHLEPDLKPLGHALYFYGPALVLGLPLMHERRDEFEERQDTGPGVFAALWGRVLGAAHSAKLPGLMSVIRRRVMPVKGERYENTR